MSALSRLGKEALALRQTCKDNECLDLDLFFMASSTLVLCAFSLIKGRGVRVPKRCYDTSQRVSKSCLHPLSLSFAMTNDLIFDYAKSGEQRRCF